MPKPFAICFFELQTSTNSGKEQSYDETLAA